MAPRSLFGDEEWTCWLPLSLNELEGGCGVRLGCLHLLSLETWPAIPCHSVGPGSGPGKGLRRGSANSCVSATRPRTTSCRGPGLWEDGGVSWPNAGTPGGAGGEVSDSIPLQGLVGALGTYSQETEWNTCMYRPHCLPCGYTPSRFGCCSTPCLPLLLPTIEGSFVPTSLVARMGDVPGRCCKRIRRKAGRSLLLSSVTCACVQRRPWP